MNNESLQRTIAEDRKGGIESEQSPGNLLRRFLANILLFTPFSDTTRKLWKKSVKIDGNIIRRSAPIPEVDGSSYTFDSLKRATNNFKSPAVVRGLFKGTPALDKWPTSDYLPSSALGDFILPIVADASYGSAQDLRENHTFRDTFLDIVKNKAKKYLFFPVQSRFHMDTPEDDGKTGKRLQKTVDDFVRNDLQLDRIWPGFSGPSHRHFIATQMVIGYGHKTPEKTTGTGWHCAISNNYFIQVAGRKRWYFISPAMSRYLYPLRNGINSMMTGTKMAKIEPHIASSFVDLEPGDLLYNPYWQWHTVINYEGLSMGVPIREFDFRSAIRSNPHYSSIVIINHIAMRVFGYNIGGYGDELSRNG